MCRSITRPTCMQDRGSILQRDNEGCRTQGLQLSGRARAAKPHLIASETGCPRQRGSQQGSRHRRGRLILCTAPPYSVRGILGPLPAPTVGSADIAHEGNPACSQSIVGSRKDSRRSRDGGPADGDATSDGLRRASSSHGRLFGNVGSQQGESEGRSSSHGDTSGDPRQTWPRGTP